MVTAPGDGTHDKKQTGAPSSDRTKGETPMEKNVLVTDESGNIYGATWPKRARGLVKSGRARFTDDSTICLACPPDRKYREDITMQDMKPEETVDIASILRQIEAVRADNQYLKDAIAAVSEATEGQEADALARMVHEREETNRVVLDFYRRIYEDLNQKAHAMKVLEKVAGNESNLPVGEITNLMYKLLGIEKTGK